MFKNAWSHVTKPVKINGKRGEMVLKMKDLKTTENRGSTPREYRLEVFSDYT